MQPVTEKELIEKAKAPRVTTDALESNIRGYYCFNVLEVLKAKNEVDSENQMPLMPELGVLTFCVIVLQNGFTVTGQSACADPNNYDATIGNRLAYEDAKKKIWQYMGYSLRQEIYLNGDNTFSGRMTREAKELSDKLSKLEFFIQGETYQSLGSEEQQRLSLQRKSMADYHQILMQRLNALSV